MARALIDESNPEWVSERDLIGPDGDADAKYLIRPIPVDRYRAFEKQCTRMVINRDARRREPEVDRVAMSDLVLNHVLLDWEGILDGKHPVPCSDLAVKKKLPGVVIAAITEHATQGGAGRTAEERAESFRATP